MNITIPRWPFEVIGWLLFALAALILVFAITVFLKRLMQVRRIWRIARIFLTAEKYRKSAKDFSRSTFEDVMRIWYEDDPEEFQYMRSRLLCMPPCPPRNTQFLRRELERAAFHARELGQISLAAQLETMEQSLEDSSGG